MQLFKVLLQLFLPSIMVLIAIRINTILTETTPFTSLRLKNNKGAIYTLSVDDSGALAISCNRPSGDITPMTRLKLVGPDGQIQVADADGDYFPLTWAILRYLPPCERCNGTRTVVVTENSIPSRLIPCPLCKHTGIQPASMEKMPVKLMQEFWAPDYLQKVINIPLRDSEPKHGSN